MLERHKHWLDKVPVKNARVPMRSDKKYLEELENCSKEVDPEQVEELEKEFGFKYRAATGELIFAMVTARVDISFPVVKLCQYNILRFKPRSHIEFGRQECLSWEY